MANNKGKLKKGVTLEDRNNDKNKEIDPVRAKQNANLKPIKPGERRNPNGRPKGKLNYDTMVDMAIQSLAEKFVAKHNADPKNKKRQITIDDVDIEKDIFEQHVNKARSGDQKAIDSFLDRRHGKATQPVELSGINGEPIQHVTQMALADEETEEWVKMWTKPKKQDDNRTDTGTETED